MPATKASAHAPAQTHRGSLEIIGHNVREATPDVKDHATQGAFDAGLLSET